MNKTCTLELHADGVWNEVASVSLIGPKDSVENDGYKAKTFSGYSAKWAADHTGTRDARALCSQWPVSFQTLELPHWPVFLIDMLPQGYGRQELLRLIGKPVTAGASADWQLLLTGAGNGVGNLRIKEAAVFLATNLAANLGAVRGFTDGEVSQRGDAFSEHLSSHGLFVAGSSGVQGEWPKILLTRARDGLLYLDHTLPDDNALEHYIVKFGRGPDERLATILRHEADYMALAALLELRVYAPLRLQARALFIPRFDRAVVSASAAGGTTCLRLAQESIATLTGMPGFDCVPSHDLVCTELIRRCTHPQAEVLEYIKRDIANLALGNKDNHARNTAVQRDFKGCIALTPLYDFAPMYLHPDGIARRIRWQGNDAGQPDWARVVSTVCELAAQVHQTEHRTGPVPLNRDGLVSGLKAMAQPLHHIAVHGATIGLEPDVHAHLRLGISRLARELDALV